MVLLKKIRKTDLFGKIGGDNLSYSKRPSWGMARHGSAETRERAACRGLQSNTHNRGEIPRKNTDACNVRILVTPRGWF